MSRLIAFLKRNKYFLLAHHPKCEEFQDDTLIIKNTQLCIGCFIAIPSFIVTLIIGVITKLFVILSVKNLFIIGIILVSGYLLGKIPLSSHLGVKIIKIISKLMVGTGGAFLVGILWHFPFSRLGRIIMIIVILEFAFFGHGLLRTVSIYRTCKKCDFKLEWRQCPGMKDITFQLDKGF